MKAQPIEDVSGMRSSSWPTIVFDGSSQGHTYAMCALAFWFSHQRFRDPENSWSFMSPPVGLDRALRRVAAQTLKTLTNSIFHVSFAILSHGSSMPSYPSLPRRTWPGLTHPSYWSFQSHDSLFFCGRRTC
ncbi:hypothetical protein BS47DRAFT_54004 [Hydnum rufescens UP504]|uniref:Uncharacterized protein n=1 Tax=Hydnum rufescens UP504 TaxID=1448309 RepID=A0A9P6ARL1_9AGAM|nr:hypothetical protein BS47DRAFT_54004 [Hydnum rufescens UP504]